MVDVGDDHKHEEEEDVGRRRTHHFVLVHGVGHGAWCWYKVRTLLQAAGHSVTCVDLSSAGIDASDANALSSFDAYDQPLITHLLSTLPADQKVVLVGHSAGGLSLTHAIHALGAAKVSLAVFVCATMLRSGFWTPQDTQDGAPDLDQEVELVFGEGPENAPTSVRFKPEFQRQLFYNESPEEDAVLASMLLKPVPVRALQSARFDNGEGIDVDAVSRVYVKTTKDRVLTLEQQENMIKRWPPCEVMTLETDHSPFFSAPNHLVSLLLKASSSDYCH
ncbi:Methylesterase 17 [Nymphaea thermarum]|nr:Methylesterase 17 [Nymphaea thermarum]